MSLDKFNFILTEFLDRLGEKLISVEGFVVAL